MLSAKSSRSSVAVKQVKVNRRVIEPERGRNTRNTKAERRARGGGPVVGPDTQATGLGVLTGGLCGQSGSGMRSEPPRGRDLKPQMDTDVHRWSADGISGFWSLISDFWPARFLGLGLSASLT